MWRWVTRGLVLSVLALLLTPALVAQGLISQLEFPDPAVTQSGMILVKGFVIDPQAVSKIELYVDDQFQQIVNSNLPRIDIVEAYPNYPGIQNIAPGFQTGFTAARFSNGPHTVYVKIFLSDGTVFQLPNPGVTVQIDNTINQAPFGSVDIPDLAAAYNASDSFPVVGWAADTDGIARVDVQMDDGDLQAAIYGDSRPDVGNSFPDFPAAQFSGFIANVDTTRLQNGIHTLTVRATDRKGLSRLIGRRTVQVINDNTFLKPFGHLDEPLKDAILFGTQCGVTPIISPPVNPRSHITPVRGWALDLGTREDIGRVSYVELLVDGVRWYSTDDCAFNPIFGAFTNCYGLPRYDVERFYPSYPDAPRSGFLFTLDVGALLALGVPPGNHVLKVRVGDQDQTFSELPSRDGIPVFFECGQSQLADPPFGFIDVPTSFDYMTGTVVFQGWALQDQNALASVDVLVDGNFLGIAQYGFPRPDVQAAYPFVFNSLNSGWRFTLDTTKFANTRHRLTVRGRLLDGTEGELGSVDFYTQNLSPTP